MELAAIFVFGTDFTRQMSAAIIPESIKIISGLIILFITLAAIILYIVRKKLKFRRDGFTSALIDTLIAFFAGGNLRMKHKLERWFFAILLISAFFITSIFVGDILFYVYNIVTKIKTFQQLAKINSPIYIDKRVENFSNEIHGLCKYVFIVHVMHHTKLKIWNSISVFRRRIGLTADFKGVASKRKLSQHHAESFIFVIETNSVPIFRDLFIDGRRDFDVLEGSLGMDGSLFL